MRVARSWESSFSLECWFPVPTAEPRSQGVRVIDRSPQSEGRRATQVLLIAVYKASGCVRITGRARGSRELGEQSRIWRRPLRCLLQSQSSSHFLPGRLGNGAAWHISDRLQPACAILQGACRGLCRDLNLDPETHPWLHAAAGKPGEAARQPVFAEPLFASRGSDGHSRGPWSHPNSAHAPPPPTGLQSSLFVRKRKAFERLPEKCVR